MPFFREDTSGKFRRPRGRPRAIKRLEIKRAAPKAIRPRPPLIDGTLPDSSYKNHYCPVREAGDELEHLLDMQGQEWLDEDPFDFELYTTIPQVTSPPSASQQLNALPTAPMDRRQIRRPYEMRIDSNQESIDPGTILMNGTARDTFVTLPRVLHSRLLEYSYIYERVLRELGHEYHPCAVWKTSTRFGLLEAKGFSNIYVARDPYGTLPVIVQFFVLPGSPPPGGVSFMLGIKDLNAVYGENSTPEQSAQQYVQH